MYSKWVRELRQIHLVPYQFRTNSSSKTAGHNNPRAMQRSVPTVVTVTENYSSSITTCCSRRGSGYSATVCTQFIPLNRLWSKHIHPGQPWCAQLWPIYLSWGVRPNLTFFILLQIKKVRKKPEWTSHHFCCSHSHEWTTLTWATFNRQRVDNFIEYVYKSLISAVSSITVQLSVNYSLHTEILPSLESEVWPQYL